MSLLIKKAGLLDTIQDAGRYGYQYAGINPGGVMDLAAMYTANALLGNDKTEAVLEMHFPAAEIQFGLPALIVLTGADLGATINGHTVPVCQPVQVAQHAVLKFDKQQTGTRVYLSVAGGFVTDEWLGSSSTHTQVKAGGYKGRALQKNDELVFKGHALNKEWKGTAFRALPWKANIAYLYTRAPFHFIEGEEYDRLTGLAKQQLERQTFVIDRQSNRMGYRLQAEPLALQVPVEMISTAVTLGTIQLLPDGQLIILMAEHQTTGGYPRVGHIIGADLSSLAQLPAGKHFTLAKTDLETAEQKWMIQQRNLKQLQNACIFHLQQYFST